MTSATVVGLPSVTTEAVSSGWVAVSILAEVLKSSNSLLRLSSVLIVSSVASVAKVGIAVVVV